VRLVEEEDKRKYEIYELDRSQEPSDYAPRC